MTDSRAAEKKKIVYIPIWFDKGFPRVAGCYENERSAWRRIDKLGSGSVQAITLNKRVRFTHEQR